MWRPAIRPPGGYAEPEPGYPLLADTPGFFCLGGGLVPVVGVSVTTAATAATAWVAAGAEIVVSLVVVTAVATMTSAATAATAPAWTIEGLEVGVEALDEEAAVVGTVVGGHGFVFDSDAADGLEKPAFDDDAESVEVTAFVGVRGIGVERETPFGAGLGESGDVEPDGVFGTGFGGTRQDGAQLLDGGFGNEDGCHGKTFVGIIKCRVRPDGDGRTTLVARAPRTPGTECAGVLARLAGMRKHKREGGPYCREAIGPPARAYGREAIAARPENEPAIASWG